MPTRILATGDNHICEGSRWDECRRVHDWFASHVEETRPDAVLFAGDLYEKTSNIREREYASDLLRRIANICPVLLVRGNHDSKEDIRILGKLQARHPITVEEGAGVHFIAGVAVAAMAWPSRASLAAMTGAPLSSEALDDVAREKMRAVLGGMSAALEAHDGPTVLLTHAMIDGSVTSTGQPLIGAELNLGLTDLALAKADVVIAGHIHKPQAWTTGKAEVLYTGSPYRTAFGELEEKSIIDLTFSPEPRCQRITTPATPMVQLSARWIDGAWGDVEASDLLGAEARFRYEVPSDQRHAAKEAISEMKAELSAMGAVSIKVEEIVRVESRARAPEITKAESTLEKLDVLWRCRGTEPEPTRRARLASKMEQLEGENHAA